MRVLMISNDYLPNSGGIAAHVYELARALAGLGHEVDLIAGHRVEQDGQPEMPLLAGMRVLRNKGFSWTLAGYVAEAVDSYRTIARTLRNDRYDVCHWHNPIWETWSVALAARALPRVFTNHSSGYLRRMHSAWRRKTQLPAILSQAHRVIGPSRELVQKSIAVGYPAERAHYIPNGVDVDVFAPGAPAPALAARYGLTLCPEERVIVVPRRFDPKNGVDVLLRALPLVVKQLPQTKLLLVGDGEQRGMLEALSREGGLERHVVFCGSQPRAEMVQHLRLAHAACLPSRAEAVSLAGLEAMAAGLPVVGSRVGGIPEFVDDPSTGRLVRVDDPEDLARALCELLALPVASIRALGANARARVTRQFSWKACAREVVGVYEAAISDCARRSPATSHAR